MAIEGRWYAVLIHRSSAAMVRSSVMNKCGVMRSRSFSTASIASIAGNEIFSLQFAAARWREVHFEVRKALVPRARDAQLLGAGVCGVAFDGMEFFRGKLGAEELRLPIVLHTRREAALDPDLCRAMILPVREETDTVAAAEDLIEMMLEMIEGEIPVNRLGNLVGRLQIEGNSRDHARGTETHNGGEELIPIFVAGKMADLAVGSYDLETLNSGGEVAIMNSGAVRGRGDRACYRNVRKRGKVMQRVTASINDGCKLAILDPCADGDRVSLVVDVDLIKVLERDLIRSAVSNGVERGARTQCTKLRASLHDVLNFGSGSGCKNMICAVGDVTGPVFARRGLLLAGGKTRPHRACHDCFCRFK